VVGALLLAPPAHAQSLQGVPALMPVPSYGESCPAGWRAGSGLCHPSAVSRPVIRREGTCPSGWTATAGWCQRGLRAADARPRPPGGCPAGWRDDGAYCVE